MRSDTFKIRWVAARLPLLGPSAIAADLTDVDGVQVLTRSMVARDRGPLRPWRYAGQSLEQRLAYGHVFYSKSYPAFRPIGR